jgi:hypothetical protein
MLRVLFPLSKFVDAKFINKERPRRRPLTAQEVPACRHKRLDSDGSARPREIDKEIAGIERSCEGAGYALITT